MLNYTWHPSVRPDGYHPIITPSIWTPISCELDPFTFYLGHNSPWRASHPGSDRGKNPSPQSVHEQYDQRRSIEPRTRGTISNLAIDFLVDGYSAVVGHNPEFFPVGQTMIWRAVKRGKIALLSGHPRGLRNPAKNGQHLLSLQRSTIAILSLCGKTTIFT